MKLVCIEGTEKGTVWQLSDLRSIIGRDSSCDVAIRDPKASRMHAEISRKGNAYLFSDTRSRNGSFINNRPVTQRVLVSGDKIKIGDTTIKVIGEDLSATTKRQKLDPLATTRIPLDAFDNRIRELSTGPETTSEKQSIAATEKQAQKDKLINNLGTLYKIGRTIGSFQSVEELLNRIADAILGVFGDIQRVCILLTENDDKDMESRVIKTRTGIPAQPWRLSWSVVNAAVEEEVAVLANDAIHDERFDASESIIAMKLRSVMCVPLINKSTVLGVMYVDNLEKPGTFDEDDLALLSALASQAAVAVDNSRLYENIQQAYHEAILALMNTVEAKDQYTRGHSQRVSRSALGIAQELGLSDKDSKNIQTAAELHDIGKIGVRDRIIGKESALSTMEFDLMKDHVVTGERIVKPIEYLRFAGPMIRHHHERYDGGGYPDGLKGDGIPLGARIIGVADAFDAMTTKRPYNEPMSFEQALEELATLKGKQFDPDVVDALVRFIKRNHMADKS